MTYKIVLLYLFLVIYFFRFGLTILDTDKLSERSFFSKTATQEKYAIN